jgi:hypothetical protein
MGSPEDCQTHAMECIDIAGNTGFILSPGLRAFLCETHRKT